MPTRRSGCLPEKSSPAVMADSLVSVEAHVARILASAAPLDPVTVPLAGALGLVSAVDVVAPLALPRFDHAAMDGYAVRATDLAAAPLELPVAGVVAAGDTTKPTLRPGTAWRIMTGAPVPSGADAVVPFEWTDRGDDRVRIERIVTVAQHIRREAEDVVAGDVAVLAGTALAPRHLALLAAVGVVEVTVHPAPRVALIATGEELVSGEVPDSNTTAIAAAGRAIGARVEAHGPVPDDQGRFLQRLAEATGRADLVVTTGGVSAGDHDIVKAALGVLDDFWFGSVAVKPGRPQGAGVAGLTGRSAGTGDLPARHAGGGVHLVPAVRGAGDPCAGRPPAGRGLDRRAGCTGRGVGRPDPGAAGDVRRTWAGRAAGRSRRPLAAAAGGGRGADRGAAGCRRTACGQ